MNALSDWMEIDVARDRQAHKMRFERGKADRRTMLKSLPGAVNRRGTIVSASIPTRRSSARTSHFSPALLYRMAKSKAYLFRGVEVRWKCDPSLIKGETPAEDTLKFPGGLHRLPRRARSATSARSPASSTAAPKTRAARARSNGPCSGCRRSDPPTYSYCNTIPTAQGGTHEQGLRNALTRALRSHGERVNNRKTSLITNDDLMVQACAMLSIFIREPEFQGQTKEKLSSPDAQRLVENGLRAHFDHWLAEHPQEADKLLDFVIDQAEDRLKRRAEKETARKSATRKLRLPGKLADCSKDARDGTEIFLVEGDRRRRLRQAGARPRDPGDPAPARQDPERGGRRLRQAGGERRAFRT